MHCLYLFLYHIASKDILGFRARKCNVPVMRYLNQDISLKKIYDVVTEDIFDMSNVSIFKAIEKKMTDVYTLICLRSAELSKAFDLKNLCHSKISVVMLLGYKNAGISRNSR